LPYTTLYRSDKAGIVVVGVREGADACLEF
jgi:hypothetical protein